MLRVVPALLCAAFAAAGPVKLDRVLVSETVAERYGAKSLDGSPPGFYISRATNATMANRWVLYIKGGGWCMNDEACAARANTSLGTTTTMPTQFSYGHGFSVGQCYQNPSFCDANRVILWYADGGSFTGNREEPVDVNGQRIWYRGHACLKAIMATLRADFGLTRAEEVLVSGGSAGALSTFLHADEMRAMVGSPSLRTYKAAPASGFFLNHTSAEGEYVYGDEMRHTFYRMNSTGGVPEACRRRVGAGREHECITAAGVWPTMSTPTFVMNSAIDAWQLGCVLTALPTAANATELACSALPAPWTCLSHWHDCPRSPVVDALARYRSDFLSAWGAGGAPSRPGFGAFIHTCATHVGSVSEEWITVGINGTRFYVAAHEWWEAASDAPAARHTHLPCEFAAEAPWQCNPTCGKV